MEKAEGVPVSAYEPFTVDVHPDGDGAQRIKATTYVVVTKEDPRPRPNAQYKALLLNGAKSWNLPADYIVDLESIAVA